MDNRDKFQTMSSGGHETIPDFTKKNTTVDLNASECSDHSGNMLDRFRTFFCRPLVLQNISQLLLSSEIGPLKVDLVDFTWKSLEILIGLPME